MKKKLVITLVIVLSSLIAVGLYFKQFYKNNTQGKKMLAVKTEKDVHVEELLNQYKVPAWVVSCKDVPIVTIGICFRNAGHKSLTDDKFGLNDLLDNMLHEGTENLTSQQFKEYLLEKNFHYSVHATDDHFVFVISTVKENIGQAKELLCDVINTPRLDPQDFHRVKTRIMNSLAQALHDERTLAHYKAMEATIGNHPYARNIEKKIKNIPSINETDLRSFTKQAFKRGNFTIAFAGNITKEQAIDITETIAGKLEDGNFSTSVPQAAPQKIQNKEQRHDYFMPIPQSIVSFIYPGMKHQHPDFYAYALLTSILGSPFISVLWNEIRENRGLVYGISLSVMNMEHWQATYGRLGAAQKNVDQVISIIKDSITHVQKNGVTQEQMESTKKYLIGINPLKFISTESTVNTLLQYQATGLPISFVTERNEKIMQVTLEQLNRVAQETLDADNIIFTVLGENHNKKL